MLCHGMGWDGFVSAIVCVCADCCDGSDEAGGCPNVCLEHSAVVRKGLAKQLEEYEAALKQKQALIKDAVVKRRFIASRLQSIDDDIEGSQVELKKLEGIYIVNVF